MDKAVQRIIKLYDGDVLVVFTDGSGLSCSSPIEVDAQGVKDMVASELELVKESHGRYLELDEISKTFKQEEAEIVESEVGDTSGKSEHEIAAGIDDAEFAEDTAGS